MTLLPPVGRERSQSSPTARSHGFAQIIGDFINAIDPKQTWSRMSLPLLPGCAAE
jgi:hypothetical protein